LTSVDQSFGGHVPLGHEVSLPLRSVFPISFDRLYPQVDISVDVAGTVDVESFDADDEHVGSGSIDELCMVG
jgi:hypothetical protein